LHCEVQVAVCSSTVNCSQFYCELAGFNRLHENSWYTKFGYDPKKLKFLVNLTLKMGIYTMYLWFQASDEMGLIFQKCSLIDTKCHVKNKRRENYAIERPGGLTFGKKYSAVIGYMLSLIPPIHCVLQLLHAKAPRLHGP
jgi:hypothetical protein